MSLTTTKTHILSELNEIYAKIQITQTYTNPLSTPIELTLNFPSSESNHLIKFKAKLNQKEIVSKILPTEKAEEKYNDTISKGNRSIISTYKDSDKAYTFTIGNLQPKETLELTCYYLQMITSFDLSYCFDLNIINKLPFYSYVEGKKIKEIFVHQIEGEINIKCNSQFTRMVIIDKEKKCNIINKEYRDNNKECSILIDINSVESKKKEENFYILYRTKDTNVPKLYAEYNEELNETAYRFNYIYDDEIIEKINKASNNEIIKIDEDENVSYYDKYQKDNLNDTPSLFIFLVDQSTSMLGREISLVRESLKIFMHSIPLNSYFQLIGFGSNYEKYNSKPEKYTKESFEKMINIIDNIRANKGGTNIIDPLESIFNNKKDYEHIKLTKNIILLTDGQVENTEKCINIIEKNSYNFIVHSIGLGKEFDEKLITKSAIAGNGTHHFVPDSKEIIKVVTNTVNICLKPYIIDYDLSLKNIDSTKKYICKNNRRVVQQNDILSYSFILDGKPIDKNNEIYFKLSLPQNEISKNISINSLEIIEKKNDESQDIKGILSKIIVDSYLKNTNNSTLDKDEVIKISKKYQVPSKYTSLFAEIINDSNKTNSELVHINLQDIEYSQSLLNDKEENENKIRSIQPMGAKLNYEDQFFPSFCCKEYECSEASSSLPMSQNDFDNHPAIDEAIDYLESPQNDDDLDIEKEEVNMMETCNKMKSEKHELKCCGNSMKLNKKNQANVKQESSCVKKNLTDKLSDNKLMEIVMKQDINGFWEEESAGDVKKNEVIKELCLKLFDFIEVDDLEVRNKIVYTFLVVYYILEIDDSKYEEIKLMIGKAKKFLSDNKYDYDYIKSKI